MCNNQTSCVTIPQRNNALFPARKRARSGDASCCGAGDAPWPSLRMRSAPLATAPPSAAADTTRALCLARASRRVAAAGVRAAQRRSRPAHCMRKCGREARPLAAARSGALCCCVWGGVWERCRDVGGCGWHAGAGSVAGRACVCDTHSSAMRSSGCEGRLGEAWDVLGLWLCRVRRFRRIKLRARLRFCYQPET